MTSTPALAGAWRQAGGDDPPLSGCAAGVLPLHQPAMFMPSSAFCRVWWASSLGRDRPARSGRGCRLPGGSGCGLS